MKLKHIAVLAGLMGLPAGASAADGPVRIGVLTDMSSALADTQGMGSVEGARMAIEDFGGSVLGRKIELVHADHQNKPDIGSATVLKWFDNDDVRLVVDLGNSAVGLAVQRIAKEKDRITIATGAATSELTGKACSPNSFHWGYDSYQFSKAAPAQMVKSGLDTWFFITADYAFGYALENDTRQVVEANGGKVIGSVRHPINTLDFSSYLLQAQASGAKVIAVASAVSDLQNVLKQGQEFQIFGAKQTPAAMALLLVDVHSVGLKATQGTGISTVFYWDQDDETRAFAKRFKERMGRPPTEAQAMNYSGVAHYLKAVKAAGTTETQAVLAKMREIPVNDLMTQNAMARADGRLMRDVRLAKVKTPAESKGPWDYFAIGEVIPADQAFRPTADSACPLLKK
ncbi:ABC transporter substrate-binding protein [Xanthobacter dioxanivorans]|uniref:ABC transporter substrate-binding protein n=1 Tax=Xanthobacter dioxanivorans TaxID=2528964 RepID=A0A974SJK6_9HYPH|nr:ABC transporter substrate-binding protein [Xanthobacter dioxanivorans]QRG07359.1 ABC transporter substrate-binding protein [Xanthobacter dioxanivorans]